MKKTDKYHRLTDKLLNRLEKTVKQHYTKAYLELKQDIDKIVAKMEFGKDLTPIERYNLANKYDRLNALINQITETIHEADKEAVRIINREMANVYGVNYNGASELLGKDGGIVFPTIDKSGINKILSGEISPFDKLALDNLKDADSIRRQLTSELTTAIMKGDSIPAIAKRIRGVTEKKMSDSIRIARTETTRVENAGRQAVFEKGTEMGLQMVKRWVSTSDGRTRHAHAEADGQIVDVDKPFIVGGEKLMYPADPNGSAGNTINCRCTMVTEIKKSDNK